MKPMKNSPLVAAIAMALAGFGYASDDAKLDIYGVIDTGIGNSQHSLPWDSGATFNTNVAPTKYGNLSTSGIFSGGLTSSRLGMQGSKEIDAGLQAIFDVESSLNVAGGQLTNGIKTLLQNGTTAKTTFSYSADSAQDGQLFANQAWVGVTSKAWGTIKIGRNYNLNYDVEALYDPFQVSNAFSLLSGTYKGGGNTEDTRLDNSIKYTNKIEAFDFGVLASAGEEDGKIGAGAAYELKLGYDTGPFSVSSVIETRRDSPFASSNIAGRSIKLTFADTTSFLLTAQYRFDQLKIDAGYQRITYTNPSDPAAALSSNPVGSQFSGIAPVGAVSVNSYSIAKKLNAFFLGGTYYITPALRTVIAYYVVNQNNFSGSDCNDTMSSACAGMTNASSTMLDYSLSKKLDIYIGIMLSKVSGGPASGFLFDSNRFVGLGGRYAF